MLTNNFVPCNGRFPTLIAIITMFFVGSVNGSLSSAYAALMLSGFIVLGIAATFGVTKLLSVTLLKGVPSSFTLELPPFRRPQFGSVLLRSLCDRTVFVLGRAAATAAPAGLMIWMLANTAPGGISLLSRCACILDPFAQLMGLDGILLMAFILGLPANEIVLPIAVMAYSAQGHLIELEGLAATKELFAANGWTWITAINMMLFSLMHWPCATTLLTIRKEAGGWKWAALAAVIPTLLGVSACILFTFFANHFI